MSRVTSIEEQKNNPDRFSVFLDGEFSFGISGIDLFNLGIRLGMEIDDEFMSKIEETIDFKKCLDYATGLVSRKMYSRKEIMDKMFLKGFTDTAVKGTLDILEEYGYINDEVYATVFCEYKSQKYGVNKLRYDLRQKGINEDIINNVLENVQSSDALYELVKKKLSNKDIDRKEIDKVIRNAASKGFAYDDIKECIDRFIKDV